MRLSLLLLPVATLAEFPASAAQAGPAPARKNAEAAVIRHADGSFTITEPIEPLPERLDALPWEAEEEPADDPRQRDRDKADEALDEAYEEAVDMARMEAGPD